MGQLELAHSILAPIPQSVYSSKQAGTEALERYILFCRLKKAEHIIEIVEREKFRAQRAGPINDGITALIERKTVRSLVGINEGAHDIAIVIDLLWKRRTKTRHLNIREVAVLPHEPVGWALIGEEVICTDELHPSC